MDPNNKALLTSIAAAVFRRGLGYVATFLLAHGFLVQTQEAQFLDWGVSAAFYALDWLWTWWQLKGQALAVAELAKLRAHVRNIPEVSAAPSPPQVAAANAAISAAKNAA